MNQMLIGCAAVAVLSYLIGSINWAVIISTLFYRKDIRDFGSGNAGMTNILRTFGKLPAALVALGDFGKGILTVAISRAVFGYLFGPLPFDIGYIAGAFTIFGHLFPVYFHFKGGKGVLTAFGMVLVIDWRVFLILLGAGLLIIIFTRIVSLASVLCAVLYPVATYFVHRASGNLSYINLACSAAVALLIIYMHRVNIKRLLEGKEYRFGSKQKKADS